MTAKPIQMMIAGAQKAGTTSLARYLSQHPQICTHQTLEFIFFVNDQEYDLGYDAVFPSYFKQCDPKVDVILAKSVDVLYSEKAARRLYEHNPKVEVVFLLRNPVDRAYSAFWFARQRGWEPLTSFEAALTAGIERFKGNWVQELNCRYLERGIYAKYLPFFYKTFGKEHVHVFLLKDLKTDPQGVCRQCFQILEIDSDFTPDVTRRHNTLAVARSERLSRFILTSPIKRVFSRVIPRGMRYRIKKALWEFNAIEFTPPPMNPVTRRDLVDFYKPFNMQLADLLGRDLSHWDVS